MTSPTKTLTGPELKVTLNGLGLPPSWFAARLGVTMRTVVRWFDGDAIPDKAAAELEKVCDETSKALQKIVHSTASKAPEDGSVVLKTYRTDGNVTTKDGKWPATWHRALTFKAMEELRSCGLDVTVEYR